MSSYCKVWINGQEIEADADRKLIDVLRNDCRLKSVKDGCSCLLYTSPSPRD